VVVSNFRVTLTICDKLRFALSSVTSWRSVDGDFDYIPFWHSIVDFFERPPGRIARQRVDQLLAWWTRCIIYTLNGSHLISIFLGKSSEPAATQKSVKGQRLICL
jgi:hypothetical protein